MGRPIFPHELGDPDFAWLVTSFLENNPSYALIEVTNLPMVFIHDAFRVSQEHGDMSPLPHSAGDSTDGTDESILKED